MALKPNDKLELLHCECHHQLDRNRKMFSLPTIISEILRGNESTVKALFRFLKQLICLNKKKKYISGCKLTNVV